LNVKKQLKRFDKTYRKLLRVERELLPFFSYLLDNERKELIKECEEVKDVLK